MRALQIIHGEEAGGVKTLADLIGDGLTSRGIACETAVLFPGSGILAKLAGTARVAWRILTGRYDAVIAYQPSASILTGVAGFLSRCPHRIVHQTALPSEIKAPMRVLDRIAGALGLYTANVANSQATAAAYAAYPPRYRRHMTMIEHGIAAPQAARPRVATLAAFGIPEGRILLNVGRLTDQKNQGVLIAALPHLPGARLVIAGDGPRRAEYAALAARLGVADRVHMLGDVTRADVGDLLGAADLFVFPSTWETFGLAAVEALMAGASIIASDLPVLREVLSADGVAAATFVAPSDTDGWIKAISDAATHEASRTVMEAVARRYSIDCMTDAYAALLEQDARREGVAAGLKRMQPHGTGVA
jgi:glycosyltransferase involved in cell wall biosynthesis